MHELFEPADVERLPLDAYLDDFERRFWAITEHGFWKLERQQTFQEPGFDSWEAFADGRWDDALRLLEAERGGFEDYFARLAKQQIIFTRVRVVEEPIAPYLQWELHVLRLRETCGEQIRVIGPEKISRFEQERTMPELVTLGTDTMYQIRYDQQGVLEGALRSTDRAAITRCRTVIEDLYAEGEDLSSYFPRQVAPLAPPQPA
jgi:hypothetical protein